VSRNDELIFCIRPAAILRCRYNNELYYSPHARFALSSERIKYGVHSSPGALHSTVRYVLRCNRRVLCDIPGGAHRTGLNTGNADRERENDGKQTFHLLKYRSGRGECVCRGVISPVDLLTFDTATVRTDRTTCANPERLNQREVLYRR
jgi:hypothetical protein